MWNLWQKRAKVRKSYPLGTLVSVTKVGEFPVVDYNVTKDTTAVVLAYRGYLLYHNVKV